MKFPKGSPDSRPAPGTNQRKAGVPTEPSTSFSGQMDSRPDSRPKGPKHQFKAPKNPTRGTMKNLYGS